ncbi:hypothetical protein D3C87_1921410 [compost metagenome]
MAGTDEGENVILDLGGRKTVCALSLQKQGEEIIGRAGRIRRHALSPQCHRF